MKGFLAAVSFLTFVPVPAGEQGLARSLPFFPVVGWLVGGALSVLALGLREFFPAPVAAVLVVLANVAISRGLHLDGLADTADGLFSSRSRERMLEIMRDSRSGPMAIGAVVGVLLTKTMALSVLDGRVLPWTLILMAVAGRTAMVLSFALLPYARPEGGVATVFSRARAAPVAFVAFVCMALFAGWMLGIRGLVMTLAAVLFTFIFSRYVCFRLGGYTGDTQGALCEWTETIVLLMACVRLG